MVRNTKFKDNGGRMIFENPTLCSQFLREYTGVELFKDIKPEDVEDMTENFLPIFSEERNSDVVKKIHLPDMKESFVIALIEHKSSVDYNVVMQIFHYMSYIWEECRKTFESQSKGITKTKDFRYPPILPIVYYEDTAEWTSVVNLKDRIYLSDMFADYLPDFRYLLFKLQEHGQAELISKRDEISFIMLINKLRDTTQFEDIEFPEGYLDHIGRAPEDVLLVFSRVIETYLREINLSEEEIHDLTDQIKRGGNMNRLFENFHGYDIQATRRESEAIGREKLLIEKVCSKLRKKKSVAQIAEELEEDEIRIQAIVDIAEQYAPKYDITEIVQELLTTV